MCLTISTGILVEAPSFSLAKGLHLPHYRPAGGARLQYLPEKTPENQR